MQRWSSALTEAPSSFQVQIAFRETSEPDDLSSDDQNARPFSLQGSILTAFIIYGEMLDEIGKRWVNILEA